MKRNYDFSKGKRGAVITRRKKNRITIRIDESVLDWFKEKVDRAGGGNYQTMINAALLEHIQRETEPLERTLRRIIREELRKLDPGRS